MTASRAFTLIELLISTALGLMLMGLGISALMSVTGIYERDVAQRQAQIQSAAIAQTLTRELEVLHHPASMRLEADPGGDGAWGSGDEVLTLTWMGALRDRMEATSGYAPAYTHDLVWHRLRWEALPASGGGRLSMATSSPTRTGGLTRWISYSYLTHVLRGGNVVQETVSASPWYTVSNAAQPRRDRRRDLDDNDLRLVEGFDAAAVAEYGLLGDDQDLEANLVPMHPPTTQIPRFVLEWVDAGGRSVRCDPELGITIRDAAGTDVTPNRPYASSTIVALDGLWLDARVFNAADADDGDPRPVDRQRPVLFRFDLSLAAGVIPGTTIDQAPFFDHQFSIAASPRLPEVSP